MTKVQLTLAWLALALSASPAAAAAPTAADFAACNAAAAEEIRTVSASPDSGQRPKTDPTAPAHGRGAGAAAGTSDPTGRTLTGTRDPLSEGVAADRVDDAVYLAAYRACMRQRGF